MTPLFSSLRHLLPLATGLFAASALLAAQPGAKNAAAPSPLAEWVEPDFPFFSSVLDARKAGPGFPGDNLTPRGIILNLGHDCWACFDPDLLRISAVWRGKGVTPKALAPGSYHDVSRKTPGGQLPAPEPDGQVWLANGIYPGWQHSAQLSLADPRSPAPDPEELGRGPLPEELGRFEAIRLTADGAVLEYRVGQTLVRERIRATGTAASPRIERHFHVAPAATALRLVVGHAADQVDVTASAPGGGANLAREQSVWVLNVPAHAAPVTFAVAVQPRAAATATPLTATSAAGPEAPAPRRWAQEVVTTVRRSEAKDAYVVDHVALPTQNPWRRGVRPSDIQFLPDGTGVVVTLDGDIWLVRGLNATGSDDAPVRWRRFTSGLHEPMTAAIRDGQIYVFDKNGIWRLRDTNGDGEADAHELFSNAFAQTADMREFPSTLRLAPNGEFIIAKGGQQEREGKHNGSVLRISADGRRATVLGYGFRQPNIGVNLRTGLVTSSDQQGQYIPSTPLHIVRDRQFYGFLSAAAPREKYPAPITEPLTWIPHAVNPSAMSQVWLFGARLGPLNDSLVHISFNKPELFRVLLNDRGSRPQAAVVSITRAFQFPPLHGSVNPADGQFYVTGFQVLGWGNVIDVAAGFGRLRYTGAPVTVPNTVAATNQGVLLRFDTPLDPKVARDPASYSLQSWHYQRTYKYGSAQYKEDGKPGQDVLHPSAAYLAEDGRSVFIAVPGLKPVEQLRVGWSLRTTGGLGFQENAYLTPYELTPFDPKAEGFGDLKVDLTPRTAVAAAAPGPVSVEEGQRVAQLFACIACHATEPQREMARIGPVWKGLFGTDRPVAGPNGKPVKVHVDEKYLRESILEPSAKIVAGYEKSEYAMPSYAGVLNEAQVESLVLYIRSLK